MANKIKLGQRPAAFKPITVTFEMPDGTEGRIECTFKYRTRVEFGAFIDRIFSEAGEARPADDQFSMEKAMAKAGDKQADYLLDALQAWDLDEQIDREKLAQLATEVPAAVTAMMAKYRAAAVEGRLGN